VSSALKEGLKIGEEKETSSRKGADYYLGGHPKIPIRKREEHPKENENTTATLEPP